jgi:hypothetical protein
MEIVGKSRSCVEETFFEIIMCMCEKMNILLPPTHKTHRSIRRIELAHFHGRIYCAVRPQFGFGIRSEKFAQLTELTRFHNAQWGHLRSTSNYGHPVINSQCYKNGKTSKECAHEHGSKITEVKPNLAVNLSYEDKRIH